VLQTPRREKEEEMYEEEEVERVAKPKRKRLTKK